MSVVITISDDGHVEAQHNSGRVLWSIEIDQDRIDVDGWLDELLSEKIEETVDECYQMKKRNKVLRETIFADEGGSDV